MPCAVTASARCIGWSAHGRRARSAYDPFILRLRDDPGLVSFCRKKGLPPPGESEAPSLEQIRAKLAPPR